MGTLPVRNEIMSFGGRVLYADPNHQNITDLLKIAWRPLQHISLLVEFDESNTTASAMRTDQGQL